MKLNFEVPLEELESYFDQVYRMLANQVRVPGFRPGKAPKRIIEAHVGAPAIIQQVINDAVPAIYAKEMENRKLTPLSQPELEVTSNNSLINEDNPLTFTAEVEVRPEIKLPKDFTDLAISIDDFQVTEEDINTALEDIQKRFATLKDSNSAIKKGDVAVVDINATVDGKKVAEASAKGVTAEIGKEIIKGLDDALIGLKKGETNTFTSQLLAGTKAGDDAKFEVKVLSVKQRDLPKVDNDFVSMASEFDTVDEFKADLAEKVKQQKKLSKSGNISEKIIDKLLEVVDIPLPEKIFNQQLDLSNQQALASVGSDKARLEKVLAAEDKTYKEFQEDLKKDITKSLRSQMLLDAIVDSNKLTVDQAELTNRILLESQQYGMPTQQFINQLQQSGRLPALYTEILRTKALALVANEIKITDEKGNVVDVSDMFPKVSKSTSTTKSDS